jgi:hypothetical protein
LANEVIILDPFSLQSEHVLSNENEEIYKPEEEQVDGGGWEGRIHGCGLAINQGPGLNILADAAMRRMQNEGSQ